MRNKSYELWTMNDENEWGIMNEYERVSGALDILDKASERSLLDVQQYPGQYIN